MNLEKAAILASDRVISIRSQLTHLLAQSTTALHVMLGNRIPMAATIVSAAGFALIDLPCGNDTGGTGSSAAI